MTIQKQLSHLSFAAIMLVFAALPALAQTGSDNQTAVVTTPNSIQVAALRTDRVRLSTKELTKESTIVVASAVTEKKPSFSATQFMKSVTEPTVISNSKVFELSSLEKPGKDFDETSSKSVNFVPSRGQKMPWQQ